MRRKTHWIVALAFSAASATAFAAGDTHSNVLSEDTDSQIPSASETTRGGSFTESESFAAMDADSSGVLEPNEAGMAQLDVDAIDSDSDGNISLEEYSQASDEERARSVDQEMTDRVDS